MNNKNNNEVPVILHGEAMIFLSSIPSNAKAIEPNAKSYHIIADSETSGNHHVVDHGPGVQFFEVENRDGSKTFFMKNTVETQVRCLHDNRHGTETLSPGTYEFGVQEEFDHVAQHVRKVRD